MNPENTSPSPSLPRFETIPYRPDGGFSSAGSAFMVAAAMVAGLVLGLIASVIGQWFYLVLLFPALIGLGMGAICKFAIRLGKVRNPLVAGLAGFMGGCMAMLTMHYCDYHRSMDELEQKLPGVRQHLGFWRFMDLQATQGVTIGRATAGNKDKGMNLGYTGSIIYWLIEVLIVAGIAYAMARSFAAEPFCRQCRDWKESRVVGGVSIDGQVAAQALGDGDLTTFFQHVQKPDEASPPHVVHAAVCKGCGTSGTIDVKVSKTSTNDQGQVEFTEVAHVTYPGEALAVIEAVFAAPPVETPPATEAAKTGEATPGEPQAPA